MSQTSLTDIEALKTALWKKLDTLPQRDVIDRSDASQWIDFMANVMPNDAMWHMIRAGGVGGSEIGGLVRNFMGFRADHGFSAHDWALSKLLRKTPEPAQGVMQRGHDMEPLHAQRFYQQYGTRRDQAAYDKLSKSQGSHIWMRYSPDDVVWFDVPTVFTTVDGDVQVQERVLIDYKAPTTIDMNARIAFQYACQLHQGAILCQEQGIEIYGCMLSQFDWASWSLKNDFVQIDPEICELIKQVGDHYWGCVMNAEIPRYVVRERLELDPDLHNAYAKAAERLGAINAMKTQLENASAEVKQFLSAGLNLGERRLEGQVLAYPGAIKISAPQSVDEQKVRKVLGEDAVQALLVEQPELRGHSPEVIDAVREILGEQAARALQVKNTKTEYDAAALAKRLKELGEDIKPYRKLTKMDPALAFDALIQAGHDPEDFVTETVRITVDPAMKARAEDWFESSFPALETPTVHAAPQLEHTSESRENEEIDRPVRERVSA